MRSRALGLATLILGSLLVLSTSAFAAKPPFQAEPIEPGPWESISPGLPVPNGPCTMGVSTGAAFIVDYIFPPNDAYYTLLDPSNCTCPNGSIAVIAAHVLLNFRAACAQPVSVSIVPAVIDANGCAQPDPSTVLCGPITYNLAPTAPGNYQFNLPMPAACCITQKAFLVINFLNLAPGCGTAATIPRLITTGSCAPCTSWNIYPAGGPDDLCVDIGFPGNPVMWVDGDCCETTAADRATWGKVKSLYR